MVKISLIVPVYNPGKAVLRCLKSIRKQTFKEFELILIDDGSTDDSHKIIEAFLDKDQEFKQKVRFIRKSNEGVAKTRNRGIDQALGEYVMFMDQDDFLRKDYLEHYYNEINNTDYDYVVGGYLRVDSKGKIIKKIELKNGEFSQFIVTAPWAHIYRRSFIIKHNVRFLSSPIGEDVYFNLILSCYNGKVKITDYTGYRWFFNENSVSNSKQNTINDEVDIFAFLDAVYSRILDIRAEENININDNLIEYYLLRYVCWYFLFTVRGSKKEKISEVYDRVMKWLSARFPLLLENPYIGLKMPKGELVTYHASVYGFYKMLRLGMLKKVLVALGK
ncbi:MAG: glycosyltransferase family 2 protein [Lachnospiraceae bacterium]|nr:glycosyltransferase family 2 protein [Lachnospiraceae bacterium]